MAGQADHMDDELEHEDDGRCGPQKRAGTRSSHAIFVRLRKKASLWKTGFCDSIKRTTVPRRCKESACQRAQATCKTTMCCSVQIEPESDCRNATKCLRRPRHLPLRALLALATSRGTNEHGHIGSFDIKAAFPHSRLLNFTCSFHHP